MNQYTKQTFFYPIWHSGLNVQTIIPFSLDIKVTNNSFEIPELPVPKYARKGAESVFTCDPDLFINYLTEK